MQGEYNITILLRFIVALCLERQSIHSLQDLVVDKPSETTVRHHLSKLDMDWLKEINHKLMIEPIKDILPRDKKCYFAIDTTDDPYYGEITKENSDYIHRNLTKKSTNHFYRYTTLYLVHKDRKFTIAVLPVKKGTPKLFYLKYFLAIIKELDFEIDVLLMDRIYYSIEIFSYLESVNIPFIVPVRHSKKMNNVLNRRKSGFDQYTMNSGKDSMDLTIAICVKYHMDRYGKKGLMQLGYIISGIDWKPQKIAKVYKKRFSIESSYRMRNIVRPRTTTKNPIIRYFFALVSMLLKNVWVGIRWRYFSKIKRGPRKIENDLFRFDKFRMTIWEYIKIKMRFQKTIPILRPKR